MDYNKKAQDPYLLLILQTLGIWHSRHSVERVTQSLRRMIYDTPMMARQGAHISVSMIIIPEDIYRYFILDDGFETARFQGLPRIKRK